MGRRVVVYGGGNTAMDTARTAKRLGATDAIVVYRRTRDRMPAHDFEVEEALEEGVTVKWLSTVTHADTGTLQLEKMELDEHGFPQPTGQFEELHADSLVLAVGQQADLSLLDGIPGIEIEDNVVDVDANMMTGFPGIFAGGDMVRAERTVTVGVGHGKKAAGRIDAWLRGADSRLRRGTNWPRSNSSIPGTTAMPLPRFAHNSTRPVAARRSTRSSVGSTRPMPCSRHAGASRAGTASPATTATGSVRTTR